MKEWILSIVVMVLLTTIITIICPEGKLGKMVKGIFSLIILLVIINPLLNFNKSTINLDFNNLFQQENSSIQTGFLDYSINKKIEIYKKECIEIIEKIGIEGAIVEIEYSISDKYEFSIYSAKIYLNKSVIKTEKEHIVVIEEIMDSISNYLNISKTNVLIYE